MLTIGMLLLSILRALTEIAGMSLLAQGALFVLAGAGRQRNIVYQLFSIITRPVLGVTRWLTPQAVSDRLIPSLAFFLLFWLWIALAYVRQFVCESNVCG